MPDLENAVVLTLVYNYLLGLPLEGKASQPEYYWADGVRLQVERAPGLTGSLFVVFSDDRLTIWSEIQMELGVHPGVTKLTEDLLAAEMQLNKVFHALVLGWTLPVYPNPLI
jgi:hypothetical protein